MGITRDYGKGTDMATDTIGRLTLTDLQELRSDFTELYRLDLISSAYYWNLIGQVNQAIDTLIGL